MKTIMNHKYKRTFKLGMGLLFLYPALYLGLRFTRYFVRQEFITFTAPDHLWANYPDDDGPVVEGYTSYSFDSERNQIGCGRIQKPSRRFGESILLTVFSPLGEIEMYIRGFTHSDIRVMKYVASIERYSEEGREIYFHKGNLVEEIPVSRREQVQNSILR